MGAEQSSDLLVALGCQSRKAEEPQRRPVIHGRKITSKQTAGQIAQHHDMYEKGPTSLHKAAVIGDALEVKRLVEKMKMNVDEKDEDGRTPFYMACKYGKLQTAKLLAQYGADPNIRDTGEDKKTPLEVAKSKEVQAWLKEFGQTKSVSESMEFHNWRKVQQESSKDLGRLASSPSNARRAMTQQASGVSRTVSSPQGSAKNVQHPAEQGSKKSLFSSFKMGKSFRTSSAQAALESPESSNSNPASTEDGSKRNLFSLGEGLERYEMSQVMTSIGSDTVRMVSIENKA